MLVVVMTTFLALYKDRIIRKDLTSSRHLPGSLNDEPYSRYYPNRPFGITS